MIRRWRWAVVAVGAALIVGLPAAVAALPTSRSRVSAAALLTAIQHSAGVAYSGYAEASGGLALPVTSQFNSLADLFGGQTQLRVWWRGATQWRVDTITETGESDLHQDGDRLWTWNYQSQRTGLQLQRSAPAARLPVAADLAPPSLARRLLSGAGAAQVSRLPVRRVAGCAVPGLRLRPSDPRSTIDSVDIWADPRTGVALRVDELAAGQSVISSQFLDFSSTPPSPDVISFVPPGGVGQAQLEGPDLIEFIDHLGNDRPPARLAGMDRIAQPDTDGAVGAYGRGVSEFTAIPLFGRIADLLRAHLRTTFAVTTTVRGQALSIGPLSLVLTPDLPFASDPGGDIGTAWLLTGTVTPATLGSAAAELVGGNR